MDLGQVVKDVVPSLLDFVSRRNIWTTTVAAGLHGRAWVHQISGGITVPVTHEYLRLCDLVSQIQLGVGDDRIVWKWTPDGKYSSKSAYRTLQMISHPIPGCSRIWKTWAPLRVKIFLWLAIRGHHWTVDRLGDAVTGCRRRTTATSATKNPRPSTTSSLLAHSQDKCGGPFWRFSGPTPHKSVMPPC